MPSKTENGENIAANEHREENARRFSWRKKPRHHDNRDRSAPRILFEIPMQSAARIARSHWPGVRTGIAPGVNRNLLSSVGRGTTAPFPSKGFSPPQPNGYGGLMFPPEQLVNLPYDYPGSRGAQAKDAGILNKVIHLRKLRINADSLAQLLFMALFTLHAESARDSTAETALLTIYPIYESDSPESRHGFEADEKELQRVVRR